MPAPLLTHTRHWTRETLLLLTQKKKSNKQAVAIDSNITLTVSSVSTLVNDSSPFVSLEQRPLPIIAVIVFLEVPYCSLVITRSVIGI